MLSSSSSSMALHHLLRPPPILSLSFLKQSLSHLPHQTTSLHPITSNSLSSFFSLRNYMSIFLRSRTFSNLPVHCTSQSLLESPEDVDDEEIGKENGEVNSPRPSESERKILRAKLPNLTVKEKKELASYAHSLGKKLKSQQVGKSGVTDTVVMALEETLEANELLKVLFLLLANNLLKYLGFRVYFELLCWNRYLQISAIFHIYLFIYLLPNWSSKLLAGFWSQILYQILKIYL